jgi:hypothetical protein
MPKPEFFKPDALLSPRARHLAERKLCVARPVAVSSRPAAARGGDLEYADEVTLGKALEGRKEMG